MSNVGGFFGTTPPQQGGFNNSANNGNPTIEQATQDTLNVAAGMPQPIAESMLFGLGIAQWTAKNGGNSVFNQPEFINSYNGLLGKGKVGTNNTGVNNNGINNNNNGNNNFNSNNLKSLLSALIQRLGINS